MFEYLISFDKILVTGPQRSGTRIAAKAISQDLGHRYVDETEVHTDSLYSLAMLLQQPGKVVVQCPALCRDIHYFGDCDDVAVVLMVRSVVAIGASQDRIDWTTTWECLELARYLGCPGEFVTIAARKYAFWYSHQARQIKHSFELGYDSLSNHSLWIPKEQRVNFELTQTEIV